MRIRIGSQSTIKLRRTIIVEKDEVCENVKKLAYESYDRRKMFCTNRNEYPCQDDGPIMGIDTHDPDNPYWYIAGFYTYGPVHCKRIEDQPKILTKVAPYLPWIRNLIERPSSNFQDED